MTPQLINLLIVLCLTAPIVYLTWLIRRLQSHLMRLASLHNSFVDEMQSKLILIADKHNAFVQKVVGDEAKHELLRPIDGLRAALQAAVNGEAEVVAINVDNMPPEFREMLERIKRDTDEPTKH